MATIVTICFDALDFNQATTVWSDAAMTIPAPDGWYSSGNTYRYATGGVLGPVQDCEDCDIPTAPCGSALAVAGGSEGQYKATINAGTDTGAVVVRFFPATIPDRCTWFYDGQAASEYSSQVYGYLQGVVGKELATGSGQDCGEYVDPEPGPPNLAVGNGTFLQPITNANGSNGATYPATGVQSPFYQPPGDFGNPPPALFNAAYNFIYQYDPASGVFVDTGVQVTMGPYLSQADGGTTLTATGPGECFMVIPKPNIGPENIDLIIDGPCGNTGWQMAIFCPRKLQSVTVGANNGSCGTATTNVYYVSVQDPTGDGTYPTIGVHDWVFSDEDGVTPFPAGSYPLTQGGISYCLNVSTDGIVTSLSGCSGTCP